MLNNHIIASIHCCRTAIISEVITQIIKQLNLNCLKYKREKTFASCCKKKKNSYRLFGYNSIIDLFIYGQSYKKISSKETLWTRQNRCTEGIVYEILNLIDLAYFYFNICNHLLIYCSYISNATYLPISFFTFCDL